MGNLPDSTRRDFLLSFPAEPIGSNQEAHVSSLVVHVRPELSASVRREIARLPGAEIHGVDASGKLLVTLETQSEFEIVRSLGAIQDLRGVLSAALVFHHCEPEPS